MLVNPYEHVHKMYHVVRSREFMDSRIGKFVCSLDRSKEPISLLSTNSTILFIKQLQHLVVMMASNNVSLSDAVIRIDPLTGNLEGYQVTEDEMVTLRLLGIL